MTLEKFKKLSIHDRQLELDRLEYMINLCYRALNEAGDVDMYKQIDRMLQDFNIGYGYLYFETEE